MSVPILALLPDDLPTRPHELAPGEVLFRRGAPVRRLFFVRSGSVRLVRYLPQGAEFVLQRVAEGAAVAEASLFNERYHCDAVADGATLLSVGRSALLTALEREPQRLVSWLGVVSGEVQKLRGRAEMLAYKTVAARLDAWQALHGPKPASLSWRAVADELAVSPEALYRELARRRAKR